jgi:hypothetical protein
MKKRLIFSFVLLKTLESTILITDPNGTQNECVCLLTTGRYIFEDESKGVTITGYFNAAHG